ARTSNHISRGGTPMKAASTRGWLVAFLVASGIVGLRAAQPAAQTRKPAPTIVSDRGALRQPAADPAVRTVDDGRRAQIKAIDEQIRSLRDQFKAQAEPLQAQLKALKDKLDADLEPLEKQRKTLVEQGESPALIALNQEEASQLSSLADREKDEIEKLKQRY